MPLDRRTFLTGAGAAAAASALAASRDLGAATEAVHSSSAAGPEGDRWDGVRSQFALTPDLIHMSAMLIASHPAEVRRAIERHRRGLDADPVGYLEENNATLRDAALAAAGAYLGVAPDEVALTDSTTMGLGLVYNGLRLEPGDEILSTEQDYFVTHEAIRLAALRSGATVRRVSLYDDIATVSADMMVERLIDAITPATRVVGLTWVHSSTGLKIPAKRIADVLAAINEGRAAEDQIIFVLDGVHGFGNQDFTVADLGCDFFIAGCHKWLFGPRGTGIVAVGRRGWMDILPTIPSFIDDRAWAAWRSGTEGPEGALGGAAMTPGGFKAYEHQWALAEAFRFHTDIGKAAIAERTRELNRQLKEGLGGAPNIRLRTPLDPDLSAGIVSFDVDGYSPEEVVRILRDRRIVASVAPYAVAHARLTPSILNTPTEVDQALVELRTLG
jgi:selenocysteine lyase/cysteine desulfurase